MEPPKSNLVKLRLVAYDKIDLLISLIIGLIGGTIITYMNDFLTNIQDVQSFFAVVLAIILIDATFSLLSFTYILALNNSFIIEVINEELGRKEAHKILKTDYKVIRTRILKRLKEIEKDTSEKQAEISNLEEKCEDKKKDHENLIKSLKIEKNGGNFVKSIKENENLRKIKNTIRKKETEISERKTEILKFFEDNADELNFLNVLADLYRLKLAQKSGELFFMSTIIAMFGFIFLGIYFILIHYNISNALFQIPQVILLAIIFFGVIYASILFIRGIYNLLNLFTRIGIVKDP